MNPARRAALCAYYGLSIPLRARELSRRRRLGTVPVCILYYHRVADWCPNPWTISRLKFQRQVEWIRAHFEIVSLREGQRRIASGRNNRPTVCITFDDGYADNFDWAIPILLRDKIPFTYFATTENVIKGLPFPHDAASGQLLRTNSPHEIQLLAKSGVEIGAHTRTHADLGQVHDARKLEREIIGSKCDLEDLIGKEVRYFAFPYGLPEHLCQEAFSVAYTGGLAGVCSAYGGYNLPGDDAFHLRRFHGDPEMLRLKSWLRLDPRWLCRREPFEPGDYRRAECGGHSDDACEAGSAELHEAGAAGA